MNGARERGRFLELDARLEWLDLSDVHCKLAKESGVTVAISSAARAPSELDFLKFGVDRRAAAGSSEQTSSTRHRSTNCGS
jgi:DNA polymerase (family 10)